MRKTYRFPEASPPFTHVSDREMVPSVSVGQEGSPASACLNTDSPWEGRDRGPEPQRRVMAQDSFGEICPMVTQVFPPQNQHLSWRAGWGWGCEGRERQDLSSLSHWLILSLVHLRVHSFGTVLKRWAFLTSAFKFQPYLLHALQTQTSYLAPIGFSFLQVVPASWKQYKE